MARGEFIQVFDSDDLMDPDLVTQGVAVLEDPAVEIAYSSAEVFGAEQYTFIAGPEYTLSGIIDVNHLTGCAMLRRSRWLAVGGQWEALRDGFEDYEFWVRVLRDGGFARRTESARFHYRVRPSSRSTEITAGGMQRTREVMIQANKDHLDALLRAAFDRMDELEEEKREYVEYVRLWQRRARPFILGRNASRGLKRLIQSRST